MSKRHMLSSWFRYRWEAKGLNRIHSPYVFKMFQALKANKAPGNVEDIERVRHRLKKDKTIITIEDHGAGSHVQKTNKRKVADIAKTSVKPKKQALLLYRLASFIEAKHVLELGTSLGVTTAYLASPDRLVHTIEGSRSIAEIAKQNFNELGLDRVIQTVGTFDDELEKVLRSMDKPDLVFLDGNHKKLPTLEYLDTMLEHCHDETVFVLDDIYWSKEMSNCWQQLKTDERFHVTIDLYHIGILIPRKHQAKEHFTLRL